MNAEELLVSLGNLRAALRGEMMAGLPADQVVKIAELQVDLLMRRIVSRVPHGPTDPREE